MFKLRTGISALIGASQILQRESTVDYGAIGTPQQRADLPVYGSGRRIITPMDYHARAMERKDEPAEPTAESLKTLEDLKGVFLQNHRSLKAFIAKANEELTKSGTVSAESKSAINEITTKLNTIGERLDKAEAKANRIGAEPLVVKTLGTSFIENPGYAEMSELKGRGKLR